MMTSVVIDREIGSWNRFRNRRQVGSYTGLCPGEYSSGKTRLQGCVTKHGNTRLRAALVETAWRLVRCSRRWQSVFERLQRRGRKKAVVAVARRLLTGMVALLRTGQRYRLAA